MGSSARRLSKVSGGAVTDSTIPISSRVPVPAGPGPPGAGLLPRGEWICWWTGETLEGGRWIEAEAPLDRIPLWVRSGSLIVTHPRAEVARGLGDDDPARPLEATLWGIPALGTASAALADGRRVRWRRGRWSADPGGQVSFAER